MKTLGLLVAVLIVAFIICGVAAAAGTSATLSWQIATVNTDGSALDASLVKETLIKWRRKGQTAVFDSRAVTAPATSITVAGLVCGDFDFSAVTVLKDTTASDETGKVTYATGVTCKPNPPTGLTAQ